MKRSHKHRLLTYSIVFMISALPAVGELRHNIMRREVPPATAPSFRSHATATGSQSARGPTMSATTASIVGGGSPPHRVREAVSPNSQLGRTPTSSLPKESLNTSHLANLTSAGFCTYGERKIVCIPDNYVKFELPPVNGPILVSVGIDIKDIPSVSDKDFSITLNAYFNVRWKDPRLIIKNIDGVSSDNQELTAVNLSLLQGLWLPDVEIRNLKSFESLSVLSKLEGIWVDEDHHILYALATRITFICPMRFNSFPMDIQLCTFQVGSFNYAMDRIVFQDEFVPVEKDRIRSILDYDISIFPLAEGDTHYTALNMNYSVSGFQLVLARKMSFYVVTYYLPSGLFVVVSWISFLVNPEVIPGRMTLLITIFLVLINIFNTIQTNSPQAEGLTAMEAWVIACIVFVFAALMEYTVILLKMKLRKLSGSQRRKKKENFALTDLTFMLVFPALFAVFNIFYWVAVYWTRSNGYPPELRPLL